MLNEFLLVQVYTILLLEHYVEEIIGDDGFNCHT